MTFSWTISLNGKQSVQNRAKDLADQGHPKRGCRRPDVAGHGFHAQLSGLERHRNAQAAPANGIAAPARRDRVLMAEVDPTVHLRVQSRHGGRQPVLAGPVELVRDTPETLAETFQTVAAQAAFQTLFFVVVLVVLWWLLVRAKGPTNGQQRLLLRMMIRFSTLGAIAHLGHATAKKAS